SSSAEIPLCTSVPRNSSKYSFSFCVLIMFLGECLNADDFLCFNNTTNELPAFGQLFRVWVALPNTERIALGILADGEVAHLRHRRFSHADFPAQFGDFIRVLVYRIHADVIHDWLLQMLASLQRAIGSIIGTTSVNVPILASTGKWI